MLEGVLWQLLKKDLATLATKLMERSAVVQVANQSGARLHLHPPTV